MLDSTVIVVRNSSIPEKEKLRTCGDDVEVVLTDNGYLCTHRRIDSYVV